MKRSCSNLKYSFLAKEKERKLCC